MAFKPRKFRSISLLTAIDKVAEAIILNRLEAVVELLKILRDFVRISLIAIAFK
jgi:hypothetical protein